MDHVHEPDQPRYLRPGKHEEDWPLGAPSEPIAGGFLLAALILCLDLWLVGVLAVRWLA